MAEQLGLAEHHCISVNLASWGGSALTDASISIPTDGVEEGRIPPTYVPGRNTVFISIGLSLAEANGAERLVLGVNAVDYSGYPDCRPDYLNAFQTLADLASKAGREGHGAQLWAPLCSGARYASLRKPFAWVFRSKQPGVATAAARTPAASATAAGSVMHRSARQAGLTSAVQQRHDPPPTA